MEVALRPGIYPHPKASRSVSDAACGSSAVVAMLSQKRALARRCCGGSPAKQALFPFVLTIVVDLMLSRRNPGGAHE